MYEDETKRRTGRSTRLIEEALRLSAEGKAVYVVCDSPAHVNVMSNMLAAMNPPRQHGIKFENANLFPELNWQTMSLTKNAHPKCVVLVDHWAIERRYGRILEMLTRFDKQ